MAKLLIVGCGYIGSRLAHKLSNEGHRVTGLKRHPPEGGSSIEYYRADIGRASELAGLPNDRPAVFYCFRRQAL